MNPTTHSSTISRSPLGRVVVFIALAIAPWFVGAETPADSLSGAEAFATCQGCHDIGEGPASKLGPDLAGILGRPAASLPDYGYSPALRDSGLVFDRATLAAWITDSEALVPSSWMLFHNPLRGDEIVRLIDYLANPEPREKTSTP